MSVKLETKNNDHVHLSKIENGQLAEIIKWASDRMVGKIIQRLGDSIIVIGEDDRAQYTTLLEVCHNYDNYIIRILKPSEKIVIESN